MNAEWWLTGTAPLIAAFGTLLSGVAALWPYINKGGEKTRRPWMLYAALCLVIAGAAMFVVRYVGERMRGPNQLLTTQAWNAYNDGDYGAAISIANDCVSRFRSAAESQEAGLERNNTPSPGTGRVSEVEGKTILDRGPLNDAATCFFIKGESASKLGQRPDAVVAYNATLRYPYARVFDPQGFFWSPAEVAADRLRDLP